MAGDGRMTVKILLFGCFGNMGKVISEKVKEDEKFDVVAGVDNSLKKMDFPVYKNISEVKEKVDVVVDFSSPKSLDSIIDFGVKTNTPLVLATTGYKGSELQLIEKASEKIPIFKTANMSYGVNIIAKILKEITSLMEEDYDIEIIEKHHNKKADSPSGTANMLKDIISSELKEKHNYVYGRIGNDTKRKKNEIGIHAVRGGTISGEHLVLFAGEEEILEIKHTAQSKRLFAKGALKASSYIIMKEKGLYNMDNLINDIGGINE
ncbi:MAG: 4-hydroxy-tetrahydrodipicolinate reductase [Bacillota bacterium]|nr:4-hydroxy-tetrahydrodipicolinate reductase [Bacillota bacterium]